MFELKKLSPSAVQAALDRALHYRALNEPAEAESICRDVLAVEPNSQPAAVTLLLSLTDQFPRGLSRRVREAREIAAGLSGEYEKAYYSGIVAERQGKCLYYQRSPGSGHLAYDRLVEAMEHFEKAETLRPDDNEDSILRWNTCARFIDARGDVEPEPEEQSSQHMLE